MRKGTTPTLTLVTDINMASMKSVYATLKQTPILITKEKGELAFSEDGKTIGLTLTQEETLKFSADKEIEVQIRAVTDGGQAIVTSIAKIKVGRTLMEGVIE